MDFKRHYKIKKKMMGINNTEGGVSFKSQLKKISNFKYVGCNWKKCDCLSKSTVSTEKGIIVDNYLTTAKTINILDLPYNYCRGFKSLFRDIYFVMSRDTNYTYNDIESSTLKHPRLTEAIQSASEAPEVQLSSLYKIKSRSGDVIAKIRLVTNNMFMNMMASFRVSILKLTGWVLFKLLRRLLTSLLVHNGQLYVLKQLCKRDTPVLLLPSHRSHLDYIVLSFVLFCNQVKLPYVAAGDNLNIAFFRNLMKSYGGFFIRRSMDPDCNKDQVYRALLKTYTEEMMVNNEMLEFFIEGGRERSGKTLHPRTGLLAYVLDAYLQGRVEDILIVPVSISYERLVEGDFVSEQLGKCKVRESFLGVVKDVIKAFSRNHGVARVDFCQAFSVKEFFEKHASNTQRSLLDTNSFCNTFTSTNFSIESSASCANLEISPQRVIVNKLAMHVAYEQSRNTSISGTNILSWILLYRFNRTKEMVLKKVKKSFAFWSYEITSYGHFLNFSTPCDQILMHSLKMLHPHVQFDKKKDVLTIRNKLESVIYLSYHANSVNMILAKEAVHSLSLLKCYYDCFKIKIVRLRNTQLKEETNINKNIPKEQNEKAELNNIDKAHDHKDKNGLTKEINKSDAINETQNNVIKVDDLIIEKLNYKCIVDNKVQSSVNASNFEEESEDDFLEVSMNQAKQIFQQLYAVLKYEYIFSPPCQDLDEAFANSGFTSKGSSRPYNTSNMDIVQEDEIEDKDEIIELGKENVVSLKKKAIILLPILETYSAVACGVACLINSNMPEKDFVSNIQKDLKERYNSKTLLYGESLCHETISNALKLLVDLGITSSYKKEDVKMLCLSTEYLDAEKVVQLASFFASFLHLV